MANKKITVVGDGAEQPLTPEEEHKIEVKIDKMLDLSQPDDSAVTTSTEEVVDKLEPEANEIEASAAAAVSQLSKSKKVAKAKKIETKGTEPKKVTKIITKFADDEPVETADPTANESVETSEAAKELLFETQTAPPLPKKGAKKISITLHDDEEPEAKPAKSSKAAEAEVEEPRVGSEADESSAEPEETSEEIEPIEEPEENSQIDSPEEQASEDEEETTTKTTPIITKFADDEPEIPEPDEAASETTDEPKPLTHTGKTIQPLSSEPKAEVDPAQASALSAQAHMQGSIVPRKPEAADDNQAAAPAEDAIDQLTVEDETIAHAFDEKESSTFGERAGQAVTAVFSRTTLRALIVLAIIAAAAIPVAMPSVRSKLTNLVRSYRNNETATSTTATNNRSKDVTVTPAAAISEVYIAKQNGTYNLYKVDAAGKTPKLLSVGTGSEQPDKMSLAPNYVGTVVALVSNRTAAGQTIGIVDVASGKAEAPDTANSIHIIDWFGDRIVYVLTKTTTATNDPNRDQLVSYNAKTKQRVVLDHAAYFNDVMSAGGNIYYTTSSPTGTLQFVKTSPEGTKQVLLNTEVWRIYRTDYNNLTLATVNAWYTYKLDDAKPATTHNGYNGTSRLYIDSPDGKHSLWVDTSSGQNVLKSYDIASGKDTVLTQQAGLAYPVRWLGNETVAYRVKATTETADYSVSIKGGTGKKLTDVADVAGLSLWY